MEIYRYDKTSKPAAPATVKANEAAAADLDLDRAHCTNAEYELAARNCIYPVTKMHIPAADDGHLVWDFDAFSFFEAEAAPDTVNPSLWMNGKSSRCAGVFEVIKDAIYQVRGLDISNLTVIRGKTGWIVQDVMSTVETSRAALKLLEEALNEDIRGNIRAVIISHTHGDHYGGIKGVVASEQVGRAEEGKIPIYVPAGFDIECVKESIFAGSAMGRRANYQFGADLTPGPYGIVSTGLGLSSVKGGTMSFVTPTNYVTEDQTVNIDGISVEFQLTPGTEAPAEMNNYFAEYRALWLAENCCGTLHNLYPIRGTQLRDASAWADYILEAMVRYADKCQVVFQSHHWPHFNTKENPHAVREYLLNNAAVYKHTHDQTLLYANQGFTAKEIARKIRLPEGLKKNWYTRPYYGALPMNARAVYIKYLGFFNGNPNDLDPLTEVEAAKAFVAYAGSADAVLARAEKDFETGDYRRAAYAAGNVVLADPADEKARLLCADAFEQLGYAAESAIWRNAYLQGARELRFGVPEKTSSLAMKTDMQTCMSIDLLLKYLGILFDSEKAEEEEFSLLFRIAEKAGEKPEEYVVSVHSGVVLTYQEKDAAVTDTVSLTKEQLFALLTKNLDSVKESITTNNYALLKKLESYLVDLTKYGSYPMIEPISY